VLPPQVFKPLRAKLRLQSKLEKKAPSQKITGIEYKPQKNLETLYLSKTQNVPPRGRENKVFHPPNLLIGPKWGKGMV